MIPYLFKVSIAIAIIYIIYIGLLKNLTFLRLNRWYLLMGLLFSFLIPMATYWITFSVDAYYSYNFTPIQLSESAIGEKASHISWYKILMIVYWAGFLISLLRLGYGLFSLNAMIKKRNPLMALGNHIYSIPNSEQAFSYFGNIYLGNEIDETDLQTIIHHEKVHIAELHFIDLLFVECASVMLWFNPFIYGYKNEIKTLHEYLADRASCLLQSKSKYCTLLLNAISTYQEQVLTNSFYSSQIKKRIKMLTKKQSKQSMILRYLLIIPILLAIVFMYSCQFDQDESGMAKTTYIEESIPANEVYKIVPHMPMFPGCIDEMSCHTELLNYIYKNIKYPEDAKKNGLEGTAVVQFIVTKEGRVVNAKILRDISNTFGDVVLKMVYSTNNLNQKWTPGRTESGKPVNVMMTLPVKFKLE